MDDISNRTLALLLVTAIVVSLGATVYTLNVMSGVRLPTGRAGSEAGEVNLTVESAISILLWNNTIDFGYGFVNTSSPKDTQTCAGYANLSIRWASGANTYYDENDCWTSFTAGHPTTPTHPFTIENEGNQNVTLTVLGPLPISFFNDDVDLTNASNYNLSFAGENMELDACSTGLTTAWTTFNGTQQDVCGNSRYSYISGADDLAVNIKVLIPATGLDPGEYKNSSITFTASS